MHTREEQQMMVIPTHIRAELDRIEQLEEPLALLGPIGAVREWLRDSELRAIREASDRGESLSRIGDALGTDKQNIHQKLRSTRSAHGLTDPAFDGVISRTLRYWLWWWSQPERHPSGAEEKGRDAGAEAAKVRAELEARHAAGLLRTPIDPIRNPPRRKS
jgi:hypothetical protein